MPKDKRLHMIGGALIMAAGLYLSGDTLLSMALVTTVALGKEVWDASGHGTPEVMDAIATVAGGWWVLFGVEVYRWVQVWP